MKRFMTLMMSGVILMPVAACSQTSSAPVAPPPGATPEKPRQSKGSCDFSKWQGRDVYTVTPDIKMMDRPYRILHPGDMRTMDHVPERINLKVNDKEVVTEVFCG